MVKWLNLTAWMSVRLRTKWLWVPMTRRGGDIRTDQIGRQCVDALGM